MSDVGESKDGLILRQTIGQKLQWCTGVVIWCTDAVAANKKRGTKVRLYARFGKEQIFCGRSLNEEAESRVIV